MPYAAGKNAWGISDRSGRRYRLREMNLIGLVAVTAFVR